MSDANRRTGRTTRMLLAAVSAALEKNGAYVVVVGHSHRYAKELSRTAYEIVRAAVGGWSTRDDYMTIMLPNGSSLNFRAMAPAWQEGGEEWRMGRDPLVFTDHFVEEARLADLRANAERRLREYARALGVEHLLCEERR